MGGDGKFSGKIELIVVFSELAPNESLFSTK
jgi:hypothetical protein